MDDKGWPWWVVALGGGPGMIGAIWTAWNVWIKRRDDRSDRTQSVAEKREERLAGENAAIIANLRVENDRTNARLDEIERDRDRAEVNARFWYDTAWKLKRQVQQAQQNAESAARLGNFPAPVWPPEYAHDLPDFTVEGRKAHPPPTLPGE
jgi:hypothetical protein